MTIAPGIELASVAPAARSTVIAELWESLR